MLVFIRLFTKSGNSAISSWLTLTCASMFIADDWLQLIYIYSVTCPLFSSSGMHAVIIIFNAIVLTVSMLLLTVSRLLFCTL